MEWPSKRGWRRRRQLFTRVDQSTVNFITQGGLSVCVIVSVQQHFGRHVCACGRTNFPAIDFYAAAVQIWAFSPLSVIGGSVSALTPLCAALINIDETRPDCGGGANALLCVRSRKNKRNFYGVKFICFIATAAADGVVLHGSVTLRRVEYQYL
jgi:hypothetical protein